MVVIYDTIDMNDYFLTDNTYGEVQVDTDITFVDSSYDINDVDRVNGDAGRIDYASGGNINYYVSGGGEHYFANADIWCDDDIDCGGTKYATIAGTDGKFYSFVTVESSDAWLEERFSDTLDGSGVKDIDLDDRFIACTHIDGSYPMHVVVTPTSTTSTVMWVEKKSGSVTVHGGANVTFDLIISAKRIDIYDKHYEETLFDATTGRRYKESKTVTFEDNRALFEDMDVLKAQMRMANEIDNSALYQDFKSQFESKKAQITPYVNTNAVSNKTFYYVGAVAIQPNPSASNLLEYPSYDGLINLSILPSLGITEPYGYDSYAGMTIDISSETLLENTFPYDYTALETINITISSEYSLELI